MATSHLRSIQAFAPVVVALVLASCVDDSALVDVPQTPGPSPVKWVLITPGAAQVAAGKNVVLQVELREWRGSRPRRPIREVVLVGQHGCRRRYLRNGYGTQTRHRAHHRRIRTDQRLLRRRRLHSPSASTLRHAHPSSAALPVQGAAQIFATVKEFVWQCGPDGSDHLDQ